MTEVNEKLETYFQMVKEANGKHTHCCICGEPLVEWGNNPEPIVRYEEGLCCDNCNYTKVIPARLKEIRKARLLGD